VIIHMSSRSWRRMPRPHDNHQWPVTDEPKAEKTPIPTLFVHPDDWEGEEMTRFEDFLRKIDLHVRNSNVGDFITAAKSLGWNVVAV
jgi:hypothetical protein